MAGLSNVSFKTTTDYKYTLSFDESVSGMLFDISGRQDAFDLLPLPASFFADGQIQQISNVDEAEAMGLMDSRLMNGLVGYHIRKFYEYVGASQKLYVAFANCKVDGETDFSFLEDMQASVSGAIFQLGIWTEQPLLNADYTPTSLISRIQQSVNDLNNLGGTMGNGATSLSVMLFPHIEADADYRKFPDIISLEAPNVSVFIGQDGSEEVHHIQASNVMNTPVSLMGFALAAIALAGAENSIADVSQFDLNKNDGLLFPELGFGTNYTPLESIIETRRNVLSMNGYIILNTYDSQEAGVFFCNEQTLSYGDFDTISKNRIMHKVKRIIRRALLPRVNENIDRKSVV